MGGTSVCAKRIMAAAEEISPSFVSACAVGMVLYITARARYVKYVITAPRYFTRYFTVM
jgi:hypothetical protein